MFQIHSPQRMSSSIQKSKALLRGDSLSLCFAVDGQLCLLDKVIKFRWSGAVLAYCASVHNGVGVFE